LYKNRTLEGKEAKDRKGKKPGILVFWGKCLLEKEEGTPLDLPHVQEDWRKKAGEKRLCGGQLGVGEKFQWSRLLREGQITERMNQHRGLIRQFAQKSQNTPASISWAGKCANH